MENKNNQTQSLQCGTEIKGRKQKQYESETDEFKFVLGKPFQLYLMERMERVTTMLTKSFLKQDP